MIDANFKFGLDAECVCLLMREMFKVPGNMVNANFRGLV
jgi:hypothetical protein